ncbi:hypothetical protein PF011_g12487, partial [Phytophthora fragariae]
FNNLIFDQIVTNKDHLSYCVRWDNEQKLTKAVASKFQAMIQNQMNLWNQWLAGYDCWPYQKIDISVVGFAVRGAVFFPFFSRLLSIQGQNDCFSFFIGYVPFQRRYCI